MPLTRIDSAFLDLDALGGIDFDVQSGVPTFSVDAANHRVGIGTASPGMLLHINGSEQNLVKFESSHSDGPLVQYYNGSTQLGNIGNSKGGMSSTNLHFGIGSKSDLLFGTKPANGNSTIERLRITSDGILLLGATSSTNLTRLGQAFAVATTTEFGGCSFSGFNGTTANEGPIIDLQRSRATSKSPGTVVVDNDRLGSLVFRGDDGTDFADAAYMLGEVDGTPNGGFVPGRLTFYTGTAAATPTERLRITSDGKVGMGLVDAGGTGCDPDGNHLLIRGASTFQTAKGHIMLTGDSSTVGQGPQIVFSESGAGSNNAGAYIGHVRQGTNSIGDLVFGTRGVSGDANTVPDERLRITSTGDLNIGKGDEANNAANLVEIYVGATNEAYATIRGKYNRSNQYNRSEVRFGVEDNANGRGFLAFATGSNSTTEAVRITYNQNVGINRTDPDQRLCVNGNIEVNAYDSASGANGYYTAKGLIIGNAFDAGKTGLTDDRNGIIWQERGLDLDFATNDTFRMKITYDGKVGIGVADPGTKLEVSGGQNQTANSFTDLFRIAANANNDSLNAEVQLNFGISPSHTAEANRKARIQSVTHGGTATPLAINPDGGIIGIGTSTPAVALDVNGTIQARAESNTGGYTTYATRMYSRLDSQHCSVIESYLNSNSAFEMMGSYADSGGSNPRIVLGAGGQKVGINTTNPGYNLEVNGSFAATTKSFIIDHPTKEGMKLRHGSLEGPENGVYVRGRSHLEVINLPDYWTGLVDPDSITVTLTPIGPSGAPRVERIENNKVYVFSEDSRPLDYFYMINAERIDVDPLEVEIPE